MATQKLDKLNPSLVIKNITAEGNCERNSPCTNTEIRKRLRSLVTKTWRKKAIRLIAWSEEKGTWYMWTKAQESKDP